MSARHFYVDALDTTNYGNVLRSFLAIHFRLGFFSGIDQYHKDSKASWFTHLEVFCSPLHFSSNF